MRCPWISLRCLFLAPGLLGALTLPPALAQGPLGAWQVADIGSPVTESATFDGDCLHVTSSGGGVGDFWDNATFVYQEAPGISAVELRLVDLPAVQTSAPAVSVQFRESLGMQSRFVGFGLRPHHRWQPVLQIRQLANEVGHTIAAESADFTEWPQLPNAWIRLERRGDSFTALWSRDGKSWQLEAQQELSEPLEPSQLVGVAIAGDSQSVAITACNLRAMPAKDLVALPAFSIDAGLAIVGKRTTLDGRATRAGGSRILRYHWELGDGSTDEGLLVTHAYAQEGIYLVRLTVTDQAGVSVTVAKELRVHRALGDWQAIDFGGAHRNAWDVDGTCHSLMVSGVDVIRALDQVSFIYEQVNGDFIIEAQILSAEGALSFGALGLMVRESLEFGDRHAFSMVFNDFFARRSSELSFAFGLRPVDKQGESWVLAGSDGEPAPIPEFPDAWLRLERRGSTLIGSFSAGGTEWFESGRHTFEPPLGEEVFVGLATKVHCSASVCAEIEFCDVEIKRNLAPVLPRFRRGDVDQSGRVNVADVVAILHHLFHARPTPVCEDAADINDSGALNITDAVYLMNHLFRGGPAVPAPGTGACGEDGAKDGMATCSYSACE